VKGLQQWATIQELHSRKVPIRKIARDLGISRNTVKRLLKRKEEPRYRREHYPSILEGFRKQILEWRCAPYDFNGTRIYRELQKKGYKGSVGPVYRLLRRIDEDVGLVSLKATIRIETPVGDQAQFDWADYEMEISGCIHTVYCFSLILAACRKKAMCFSLKSDADAIYEAIQELFDELGGVTLELLIDNPKALVIENNPKSEEEIRYNPQALLLAKHLGIELNACPCYWPRKKGKIEKPFQYIEEQFIKGNHFSSMEELNRRGKEFIREWNGEVHGTTGRIPDEFYDTEERQALLPLPSKHFRVKELTKRVVSNDSLVSIDSNQYSLPVKYVGKDVFYRIVYGFRIEIYDKKENLILKCEASMDRHNIRRIPEHYEAIAPRTSTSIPQIRRDFTAAFSHGAVYLECAGRKFEQPTHHARRILELLDLYEAEVLDRFIAYAIEHDKMDIKTFKRLLKEKYREIAYSEEITGSHSAAARGNDHDNTDAGVPASILRECSYYESIGKEDAHGDLTCHR
jgi:transposase